MGLYFFGMLNFKFSKAGKFHFGETFPLNIPLRQTSRFGNVNKNPAAK